MNNTKHVTSLEISKKLKELGVKQDSEFFWTKVLVNLGEDGILEAEEYVLTNSGEIQILKNNFGYKGIDIYSAFLASELGDMLPHGYSIETDDGKVWKCLTRNGKQHTESNTIPDAMGIMLIYLIENNLLKARAQ